MSTASSPTRVRLTTYNVLSSHLSSPQYFTACTPENCDPKARLEKVKAKLDREIARKAVVCLQEISHQWTGALHPFFASKGYHFVTALYGNRFNGYMGVGVAIPLDKYEVVEVDITRVADVKRMPRNNKDDSLVTKIVSKIKAWFYKTLTSLGLYKPPIDMWDSALYRSNQMICTRLECKETGRSFVVGNYHMPCMFKLPSVMNVHCSLSAQHLQRFAKNDPYVYLGDFNIKPDSSQYQLLTQGTLDKSHVDYPHPVKDDSWLPDVTPFRSAYVSKLGSEPDFTNYAKIKDEDTFIATLDYIFHSDRWSVNDVEALPARESVEGPLPNKDEPSDHILISAEMSLEDEKLPTN